MRHLQLLGGLVLALTAGADFAWADLQSAAEAGDVEAVRKALDAGADPNEVPEETWTALHIATLKGHTSVVVLLIERGADVKLLQFGHTPLTLAIEKGEMELIRILLKAGSRVDTRDAAFAYPIHKATERGNLELVELLLVHGAKLDAVDRYGGTPLTIAVKQGHFELVRMLLARGANVNARMKDGRRALHIALRQGHGELVPLLLDRGAKQDMLSAAALGNIALIDELLARGAPIDLVMQWSGTTPLMWAARAGQAETVKHLLTKGAQRNALGTWKYTALHYAAGGGDVDTARILLDAGSRIDAKGQLGTTPLIEAAKAGHGPMVALLAKRGADVNAAHMQQDLTALYEACFQGHADAVRALLTAGAEVGRKSSTGRAPMHAGVAHTAVLELLLDAGAKPDVTNQRKRTPLHDAAQEAHRASVLLLLSKGASVSARDDRKQTPLHAVASKSLAGSIFDDEDDEGGSRPKDPKQLEARAAIAKALLAKGADIIAKDARGRTPLAIARENGFDALIAVFEQALELR